MRGDGRVFQRGRRWWIEYWVRGRQFRESAGATEREALCKLKARLKEVYGGHFIGPSEEKVAVDDLAESLILRLKTKGARSVPSFESHLKPVREFFALTRAVDLTTARVEQFIQARLAAGKAPRRSTARSARSSRLSTSPASKAASRASPTFRR